MTLPVALCLALILAGAAPQAVDGTAASADGVSIHFHAEGAGEPALVFLHGWSCDSTYWNAQVKEFSTRHRVVTVDLAGHGASGAARKIWSIPAFGADVAAVVKKLDLHAVVLVGHSMSGPVAVEAALRLRDRVKLIVPVDSLQDVTTTFKPEERAQFFAPFEKDFVAATRSFARSLLPADAPPAIVDRVVGGMSSARAEVALPVLKAVVDYDLTASLPKVKAPIRAINADDYPTNVQQNRKYAPRFDVTIMKGTGHFPMLVAPAEFNRLLADAVADLTPPPHGQ